jgi:hypothetical protein
VTRINCVKNNNGAWCKDKRVKRSLFGIGARCCLIYDGYKCPYQEMYIKPRIGNHNDTAYTTFIKSDRWPYRA